MFVDSHCHLSDRAFADDLPGVLAAMADAGVDRALCICTTLEEFPQVHGIASGHDNLWCSVGVHPDNEDVEEPAVAGLLERAALPKVIAIGETGLDYFRMGERSIDDMEWQRERFRVHIRAALEIDRPLVVHTRNAPDDTLRLVREAGQGRARGVFHCFTESAAFAREALDLGFYISFSGILTFKNAQALRDVAAFVPLDRCLIETDSPYLAPVPHRGKTNSPAYVPWVARQLSVLKGQSVERIAEATSLNFEDLFSPLSTTRYVEST